MADSLRCVFEVTAGLIPGRNPEPRYTRRFPVTSSEWDDGSVAGVETFMRRQGEAMVYALSLQHPNRVNWVRLDWIWM